MLVSKKNQYAIRAVIEFVRHGTQVPAKAADVARLQGISVRFMEIILNDLKRGGILESRRGAEGGYLLAKKPEDISFIEIIEIFEGPINGNLCLLDLDSCIFGECVLNGAINNLTDSVKSILSKTTIKEEFGV